jgi:hypothetical protein
MQHSIAARYAVRPVSRFVGAPDGSRSRRLGLRAFGTFTPAPARATILRRADLGPLVQLRAGWRAVVPARPRVDGRGAPRPAVAMRWARSGGRADRRSRAATAAWRA